MPQGYGVSERPRGHHHPRVQAEQSSRRAHAIVDSAAGLVPFGHLGWGYRHRPDFHRRAAEYLTDGLRRHQRVAFVGAGPPESLAAELRRVRRRMAVDVSPARIDVVPVRAFYTFVPGTDIVDPRRSVAARMAATECAVAKGFSGFRAVVDATAVARTDAQRDSFAAFECLVDQQMMNHPVSALCAYDVGRLGADAAELVCLHPYVNRGSTPFQVFASNDGDAAVCGDVDAADGGLFTAALRRIWRLHRRARMTIDAAAVTFMAAGPLRDLDAAARADGVAVELTTSSPTILRLAELAAVRTVKVELVPTPAPSAADIEKLHEQLGDLRNKLASQPVIEQAKGMLMQSFGLTAEHAFDVISMLSQNSNHKVRDVACHLVAAWTEAGPRPDYDAASGFLVGMLDQLRRHP